MNLFFEKLSLIKNIEGNYSCHGTSPLLNKNHNVIGKIKIEIPNCIIKNKEIIVLHKEYKNESEIS